MSDPETQQAAAAAEESPVATPPPAEPDAGVPLAGDTHLTSSSGTGETFADAEAPPAPDEVEVEPEVEVEVEPDKYLLLAQRTQADFDNFRRRATREQSLAGERGVARLAKELLPALDHLELALQAVEQDPAHAEIAKGFRLVQDELAKALGRAGVEAFSPQGEVFDPNEHEAMTQQTVEGAESGTVAQVYQRGYRLGQSVLRPARVVVAA